MATPTNFMRTRRFPHRHVATAPMPASRSSRAWPRNSRPSVIAAPTEVG